VNLSDIAQDMANLTGDAVAETLDELIREEVSRATSPYRRALKQVWEKAGEIEDGYLRRYIRELCRGALNAAVAEEGPGA